MADRDGGTDESYSKRDEDAWDLGDGGKAVVAVTMVIVFWSIAMVMSGDVQRQLSSAGDALGAVGAVIAVGGTYYAVRGLNLQRAVIEEQRDAFAKQLKAQQEAVAEDHRQQRLAALQSCYADFFIALRECENVVVVGLDTMRERPMGRQQIADMNAELGLFMKALSRCYFLEPDLRRHGVCRDAFIEVSRAAEPLVDFACHVGEDGYIFKPLAGQTTPPKVDVPGLERTVASWFRIDAAGTLTEERVGELLIRAQACVPPPAQE